MTTITEQYILESNLIEGVEDPQEVSKSIDVWKYLIELDHLSVSTICTSHFVIMKNLLDYTKIGSWRPYNVQVGTYIAPHYHEVPMLMNGWIKNMENYMNLDPKDMHVLFEYIHPFVDGNGRIGRLLMWWHEAKLGRIPTLITYKNRNLYYDWFRSPTK